MSGRRVVVTGMGTVNPLGHDVATTWERIQKGASGVGRISLFDPSEHRVQIAAEVKAWDPEPWIPKKEARRLDRNAQFFWAASDQALSDAGLSYTEDDPEALRAGVALGSGIGGIITFQDTVDDMRARGVDRVSPLAIPKIISNMAGGVASIQFNLFGPNICSVTACAASANAIGDSAELIKRGQADVMLTGGTEAGIVEVAMSSFASARALSSRNDDPEHASRPFDADRDGFVMAEGAAALILEEREHALARGADIYGEVVGYGMSADGYHITLPRPGGSGAARAMTMALDDAGLNPEDIGYINAHGTSTPANDATETNAIKLAFGDSAYDIPVSSTKSMTGHMLGGAGALEALLCLKALTESVLPPTTNYTTADPDCDLDYVPNSPREATIRHAMSNSFGFGGHNVSLVLAAG